MMTVMLMMMNMIMMTTIMLFAMLIDAHDAL